MGTPKKVLLILGNSYVSNCKPQGGGGGVLGRILGIRREAFKEAYKIFGFRV